MHVFTADIFDFFYSNFLKHFFIFPSHIANNQIQLPVYRKSELEENQNPLKVQTAI